MLTDVSGKKLDALTVFSRSIEFFRDHLTSTIKDRLPELQDNDIGWILTVPAIWSDSAKKFMRLAAERVRCLKSQLIFVFSCILLLQLRSLSGGLPSSS